MLKNGCHNYVGKNITFKNQFLACLLKSSSPHTQGSLEEEKQEAELLGYNQTHHGSHQPITGPSAQAQRSTGAQWQVGTRVRLRRRDTLSRLLPGLSQENLSPIVQTWHTSCESKRTSFQSFYRMKVVSHYLEDLQHIMGCKRRAFGITEDVLWNI